MNRFKLSILFLLALLNLAAQEVILPISGNPVAQEYYENYYSTSKKNLNVDTLNLPFIDDFSDSDVQPDPLRWTDNYAFINNRYSPNPITSGIATLDSYNFDGSPYPNASTNAYIADYLSSNPINLDYNVNDNIYLSFYYQAKGLGEQPDENDSLCLEFFNVDSLTWDRIWSVPGVLMEDFKRVMIPVNDFIYLKNGFQFRFLNYASLPNAPNFKDRFGNWDHWHIDYIVLDKNRNQADTVFRDVSFVRGISSMIKDYEAIPWAHLQSAYIEQYSGSIDTEITNLDTADRNVSKFIEIKNIETGNTVKSDPLAIDIIADTIFNYYFDKSYQFDFNQGDEATLLIRTILQTDAFDYKANDTLSRFQVFKKYYAYDDGTAEVGYGLSDEGTESASAAVHFKAFKADTLRAVDLYFNQIEDSLNLNNYFYLNLWDDNEGEPGNLIYEQIGLRPAYSSELNKFIRYELDFPVFLEGDFYLGWSNTVEAFSNFGMDLNRNNSNNNFYNLGFGWRQSQAPGTFMIRPVFSILPLISGTNELLALPTSELMVYPNPADQLLNFSFIQDDYTSWNIEIIDLTGRLILKTNQPLNQSLNISDLNEGVYILSIRNMNSGFQNKQKIIIRR
ncbi:MAG: T9SS type A sorting domain-containing protein [Bacteroidales bacterium]|nr:T9SS type A sorting domain-containing protein [Bacteroidales bacterium]